MRAKLSSSLNPVEFSVLQPQEVHAEPLDFGMVPVPLTPAILEEPTLRSYFPAVTTELLEKDQSANHGERPTIRPPH